MGGNRFSLRGLAAFAVVCASFCLGATSASAAPLLWSLNSENDSVSTIDTATDQVAGAPILTAEEPISVAITPDGRRAYVANAAGESVTPIETTTRTALPPIGLPAEAEEIAISPDGKLAYVTGKGTGSLFPINTETNEIGTPIPVGPEASAVAFTPDGRQAYVGIAPQAVQVIETATGKAVGKPIEVGGYPSAIAFTPSGEAAYVAAGNEVAVISTALGQKTLGISSLATVSGIAMDPRGSRLYVSRASAGTVTDYSTSTNEPVGPPIGVVGEPEEIAITPSGSTAYVAVAGSETVVPLDAGDGSALPKAGTPISMPGAGVGRLVVAPDLSPTAAFTPPAVTATQPATFDGAASTDPDGSIASYSWAFGDGGNATGASAVHTYAAPGAYEAKLSVVDDEGCGTAEVFTGRTAYCGGSPTATVTHPVAAKSSPSPAPACSANFRIGGVSHNRRNGTVRLRLRFPTTGWFLLIGKKVHVVTRKVRKPGAALVTLHARVELNKRLKKTLHARVGFRITFTPNGDCGTKTSHRSVALLRATAHRHRGAHRHR